MEKTRGIALSELEMKIILSVIYFFVCLMAAQLLHTDYPSFVSGNTSWIKPICAFFLILPVLMAFGFGILIIDKMDEYQRKLHYQSMSHASFGAVILMMILQILHTLNPEQILPHMEIVPSAAMIWFFVYLEILEKKKVRE